MDKSTVQRVFSARTSWNRYAPRSPKGPKSRKRQASCQVPTDTRTHRAIHEVRTTSQWPKQAHRLENRIAYRSNRNKPKALLYTSALKFGPTTLFIGFVLALCIQRGNGKSNLIGIFRKYANPTRPHGATRPDTWRHPCGGNAAVRRVARPAIRNFQNSPEGSHRHA